MMVYAVGSSASRYELLAGRRKGLMRMRVWDRAGRAWQEFGREKGGWERCVRRIHVFLRQMGRIISSSQSTAYVPSNLRNVRVDTADDP